MKIDTLKEDKIFINHNSVLFEEMQCYSWVFFKYTLELSTCKLSFSYHCCEQLRLNLKKLLVNTTILSIFKIRWVVVSDNVRIKRFKYLDHVMPNSQVPFIGDFVRIVSVLSNKYSPSPTPSQFTLPNGKERGTGYKHVGTVPENQRFKKYGGGKEFLNRKVKVWKSVDACDISNFPRLSDEQLSEQLHLVFTSYA